MTRLLFPIIALWATLSSCSAPVAQPKQTDEPGHERMEREAVLSAKIRCAQEGRRLAGNPTPKPITKLAYNQKLNTCLLEETYMSKVGRSGFITDVLTNELLVMYSVSTNTSQWTSEDRAAVMKFDKLEQELFPPVKDKP